MPFNVITGQSGTEPASTSSHQSPVAELTVVFPSQEPPSTVLSPDVIGPQAERLAGYTAAIASAQSAGMTAAMAREARLNADMAPLGASYGDEIQLPPVVSDWSKKTGGTDATSYNPAG